MKEFIFLTNQYIPKPGGTGMCIHQIAKELVNRGHLVTTICYEDKSMIDEANGVKIVRIPVPSYLLQIDSEYKVQKMFRQWQSMMNKLIHILNYPLRSNKMVKDYEKAIIDTIKINSNEYITIIASYTPLEAVIAASNIKIKLNNCKVKCVYYSADTISNEQGNSGMIPPKIREYFGYKWEVKLFEKFDKILIMECHKNYYLSRKYNKYIEKIKVVNFPLFVVNKPVIADIEKIANHKKIVYVGTLYKSLRNPQVACDCMREALKYIDLTMIFVGGGDCNDILKLACKESNQKIDFIGVQTHEIAERFINSADILLSIGNKESPMAPSKIYEYMSTGKPIIHFYTDTKDPCIDPLSIYKNTLIIDERKDICIKELVDFILKAKTIDPEIIGGYFESSKPSFTTNYLELL